MAQLFLRYAASLSRLRRMENRRISLEKFGCHRYVCTAVDENHVMALPQ
jgi:hypothetical protein